MKLLLLRQESLPRSGLKRGVSVRGQRSRLARSKIKCCSFRAACRRGTRKSRHATLPQKFNTRMQAKTVSAHTSRLCTALSPFTPHCPRFTLRELIVVEKRSQNMHRTNEYGSMYVMLLRIVVLRETRLWGSDEECVQACRYGLRAAMQGSWLNPTLILLHHLTSSIESRRCTPLKQAGNPSPDPTGSRDASTHPPP